MVVSVRLSTIDAAPCRKHDGPRIAIPGPLQDLRAVAGSGHPVPELPHQHARALLDRGCGIEREILAIAACDQLDADRLVMMNRDRHHRTGQAEHVDGRDEADLVEEDLANALRTDRKSTRLNSS